MEIIKHPPRDQWASLLARPSFDYTTLFGKVQEILDDVRINGDKALIKYTKELIMCSLKQWKLPKKNRRSCPTCFCGS